MSSLEALYDDLTILRNHADAALQIVRAVPGQRTDAVTRDGIELFLKHYPESPLRAWLEHK